VLKHWTLKNKKSIPRRLAFASRIPHFNASVGFCFGLWLNSPRATRRLARYGISRADCDAFAAASHAKAHAAAAAGKFDAEIVAVEGRDKQGAAVVHRSDEGVRPGTTAEALGQLETLVKLGVCPPLAERPQGVLTAGNASQVGGWW
jgi:acetyl-CoA acetyltransferase